MGFLRDLIDEVAETFTGIRPSDSRSKSDDSETNQRQYRGGLGSGSVSNTNGRGANRDAPSWYEKDD